VSDSHFASFHNQRALIKEYTTSYRQVEERFAGLPATS